MLRIPRLFAPLALLVTALLTALSSIAQEAREIKDRRLVPADDFGVFQMPVEIVAIRLNGKEVVPGEPVQGDDDWLQGVSFKLKNISDKPIAYLNLGFKLPTAKGFVVYFLTYGIDLAHGETVRGPLPPAIQPGQSLDLGFTKERYQIFLNVLEQARAPRSFDRAPYYIETVCFENEPEVIWKLGYLARRHPTKPGQYEVLGRYTLPDRQK